jgi:hypothetical protein
MFINEFFSPIALEEGINDQYIFKAIFVCGAPGSGKNTVIRNLGLDNLGLKVVDVDETIARLRNRNHDYNSGGDLTLRRQSLWASNYLGLAVSTTGRMANKTLAIDSGLKHIGYDTMMIFVDVDKDIALNRVNTRPDISTEIGDTFRTVDSEYFHSAFEQIEKNIPIYKEHFAHNFVMVTNNDNLVEDAETLQMTLRQARRAVRQFLQKPLTQTAHQVIQQYKH